MILFKKILKWTGIVLVSFYLVLVVIRAFHFYNLDQTNLVVEKIHNTKLQMADVMGEHLPPDPGSLADDTVAGVDANKNGIRDDVELAVFEKYPNSAKTRAALLQYALALQMQLNLPILNELTVTASVEDNESRALNCIWSITSREDLDNFVKVTNKNESFIKELQFNTKERISSRDNFYKYLGSYSVSKSHCDINLITLPN